MSMTQSERGWLEHRRAQPSERSAGVSGSPDELGPALLEVGTTFFTVGLSGPTYDVGKLTDWIAFRNAHNASL